MSTLTLEHRYAPRGTAKTLFECREPEILVSGPAGTGKSRACLEKLMFMALVNPGMRGLIVRKTMASLGSTALVTWREHVIKEALVAGDVSFYGGSAQHPPQYRFTNGSAIAIGGMDKSTKIMSSEYDVVYVQEATELLIQDWEAITTRLRNGRISFQQLIADANPAEPTHWLHERCNAGLTMLLNSRHEENPVYFADDGTMTHAGRNYIAKLDRLTGVRYQRLRLGLWVAAEGVIYEDWDPAVNLIDQPRTIPESWTRYWSVDFGFTNPFVVQFWAEDPDGRLYLYREIYMTGRTVDQHAADIMKAVSKLDVGYRHPKGEKRYAYHGRIWREPKPRAIICDHDAEGRAVLERELGMSTVAAHKKVKEGVEATQVRFRRAGDGRPRLYLCRDSLVERDDTLKDVGRPTCTVEELPAYIWRPPRPGEAPKEEPRKEDDHGMDAMRYIVADRDLVGRPNIRWLG